MSGRQDKVDRSGRQDKVDKSITVKKTLPVPGGQNAKPTIGNHQTDAWVA
jgi:hypothetical protein